MLIPRILTSVLAAACVLTIATHSLAESYDDSCPGEKVPLQNLKLSGTVVQEEVTKRFKDGSEASSTVFFLKTDAEKIAIRQPALKDKKGNATDAPDLSEFVDKRVDVEAKGYIRREKDGAKRTIVYHVTSMSLASST